MQGQKLSKFPPAIIMALKLTSFLSASAGVVQLIGSLALVPHLEGTSIASLNPQIFAFLVSTSLAVRFCLYRE